MGWLNGIRGKLNEANEAFADAHKAWKDDRLDGRETAIEKREASVAAREATVNNLQEKISRDKARWFRRKLGFGIVALAAAMPSFLIGVAVGTMTARDQGSIPRHSSELKAGASSAPRTARQPPEVVPEQPELDHDEIGSVTMSSRSELPPGPIASCTKRGVAYFKEIGSYPVLRSAPNAGRASEDVAFERCTRTTTAF